MTMIGSLPPSSSTARQYPMRAAMDLPIDTPPVNVIKSTAGFVISSSAITTGWPVTTFSICGGKPALQCRLRHRADERSGIRIAYFAHLVANDLFSIDAQRLMTRSSVGLRPDAASRSTVINEG
ncbi:hypothetical protein LMG27174_06727 [Paraburkholderia rhynchosiae]|uniref:Uncharacterized protein n=1 Tax=Paraburkholderia rhynchosiae TaxID=487049 RepID=A0A6J5CS33_9BURK|nr:hypothetical protein LMG27174_06727 [Paraburkholderia rhynchosiae]